ncbi:MAG: glycosyl transferase, group 1 [Bryobacterales bacterium]|nr:glycosyl transferase, group 1 [Bryobacterales bacterium]
MLSPMPPSKSGIADYSAALAGELAKHVDLTVFDAAPGVAELSKFDIALYQLGNNPFHSFVYEAALKTPGVVVMHESNLHHLITDLTIRRGDWDGYVAECEYNGGAVARDFSLRVRRLEVGPDYDGLPMTRRLLTNSRGLVAHSGFVLRESFNQGFDGPAAVIPHGAWIPSANRLATRHLLGLGEQHTLIGAFGFLKPYKRIAESLRAFRRLVRLEPNARMILVGEPHPEFPVEQLIRTLGLRDSVRILGFVEIEKFVEYIAACDIVLNLRFPTVGETSGSLTRAMGLGRAVLVSDVGSFSELPDDVCLKVPVGADEEDLIFEYLNTLVSRPDLALAMGGRAKAWVERECRWDVVGRRYAAFLGEVVEGRAPSAVAVPLPYGHGSEGGVVFGGGVGAGGLVTAVGAGYVAVGAGYVTVDVGVGQVAEVVQVEEPAPRQPEPVDPLVFETWLSPEGRAYAANHKSRFVHTLEITPRGDETQSVLEMGAYMQLTPALQHTLGYGYVRGCYYGPEGRTDHKHLVSEDGTVFECEVDHFDAEKHVYPYADESFDTVLCCELIEHLFEDPMFMMSEINRILKPGGHLVMTTPNAGSLRAVSAILLGYHPAFFPAYIRPRKEGEEAEARHNREYVPMEIQHLLTDSGFELVRLETGEFLEKLHPELAWVTHLLQRYKLSHDLRGDGIYAVGRKAGPIRERWPAWLYS